MDNYKDVKETKIFDDNATLLEIKEWIHSQRNDRSKIEVSEISLATADFSDVVS